MEKKGREERLERSGRLKAIRRDLGITQEVMAEKLGVALNTYKAIELGTNNLSLDMVSRLHDNLGVSADYILFGETRETEETWLSVDRCDDFSKMNIMVRLITHFCTQKGVFSAKDEIRLKKIINEIKDME